DSFALPPMPKQNRRDFGYLANCYKLNAHHSGNGKTRFLVLTKTSASCIPKDIDQVQQILERLRNDNVNTKVKTNPPKLGIIKYKFLIEHGKVVGENSNPLDETNKGNKLLQKLGWVPGTGLGLENNGIVDPVVSVIRQKRRGLGT
ncbi:G-patch-domain-containing protein, partial [Rozella allomycis CSF55]